MIQKTFIKKLNELMLTSINLLEVDFNSSLIISRKILEMIVHRIFEKLKLEKPKDENGYYILSSLIAVLYKLKKIDSELFDLMSEIRKHGNNAAHINTDETSTKIAEHNIRLLSKVTIWFLDFIDERNNSLYMLVKRKSYSKIYQDEGEKVYKLYEILIQLNKLSILKNRRAVNENLNQINYQMILDDELKDYFELTEYLKDKYEDFFDEFDNSENPFTKFLRENVKKKKKVTAGAEFKKFFSKDLERLNKMKTLIKHRYNLG